MMTNEQLEEIAKTMLTNEELGRLMLWVHIEMDLRFPNWPEVNRAFIKIQQLCKRS